MRNIVCYYNTPIIIFKEIGKGTAKAAVLLADHLLDILLCLR